MFPKWYLNRNPFYTQPISITSLDDFAGRTQEIKNLKTYSKYGDGVIMLIGEPGVGCTSIGNFGRFSIENGFSIKHEFRMENIYDGTEMLKTLVFGLARELKVNKFRSKTARAFLKEYTPTATNLTFSLKALGVGVNVKEDRKGISENAMVLHDIFNDLIDDILKATKQEFVIFQLNNMNVHSPDSKNRIHTILEQMRDVFQTRKTLWYLLGDNLLEKLVKNKIPRLNSIIKHWLYVNPMESKDFNIIYQKRIKNSGPKAISPFSKMAVDQLCNAAYGRIRLALEIASSLTEQYAEELLPDIIDEPLIKKEAKRRIENNIWKDFNPGTKKILKYIINNPGKTSKEIATGLDIMVGNLSTPMKPLIKSRLVEKRVAGRAIKHYPIGLAEVIRIKELDN